MVLDNMIDVRETWMISDNMSDIRQDVWMYRIFLLKIDQSK